MPLLILSWREGEEHTAPQKKIHYLFRFTIAHGIPVGVLKAGRSFPASCTALILKT